MYNNYSSLQEETWFSEFGDKRLSYDYLREYLKFIVDSIADYDEFQYGEYHHVIPKCIDKEHKYDQQMVKISGYNHFLAHCKLIYCFEDKEFKYRLSCAVNYMNPLIQDSDDERIAEEYQRAKELQSELMRERLLGTRRTEETIARMRKSQKKRYEDPDKRIQLSVAHRGYKFSEEARENMRKANKGSNNPMYGKHHSPETIRKMNESRRLRGYNLVCKVCGESFKSHAPNTKRCDACKLVDS